MALIFPTLFSSSEIDGEAAPPPVIPQQKTPRDHVNTIRAAIPRIADAIELLWGTPELQAYLSRLIIDDQHYETGVSRSGFAVNVMSALLAIHNAHSHFIAGDTDVWGLN